jgi:hypothetical protein
MTLFTMDRLMAGVMASPVVKLKRPGAILSSLRRFVDSVLAYGWG